MIFFVFSIVMLLLALIARYRSPAISFVRGVWFVVSFLPGELPWLFGLLQLIVTVTTVALALFNEAVYSLLDVVSLALSVFTLALWYRLHRNSFSAGNVFRDALRLGLGDNFSAEIADDCQVSAPSIISKNHWLKPFCYRRSGVERLVDIAYGSHPRQRLDIYRSVNISNDSPQKNQRPVLLHVHGGGWVVGQKRQQAQPLIQYLTQNGWLCVDINYRLAPKHPFPDCLVDVKTAIAWIKTNIAQYGGDPTFIALTGGSAGAHLCALSSLTPNAAQFQPGFESIDTQVQAVVPMYGVLDFTNSIGHRSGDALSNLLHKRVMPRTLLADPDLWQAASPRYQIRPEAPPMFIIHGTTDCLVYVEETRDFVAAIRTKSLAPVVYAELEGAQHAFDLIHGVRTQFSIEAVGKFLQYCYSRKCHKT